MSTLSKIKIQNVKAADIEIEKPDTTRAPFSKSWCAEMAKSIDQDGLLYPPIVQPLPGGKYKVLAGRKRTYACVKVLGWEEVPCRVTEANLGQEMAEAIEDADNIFRMDLTEAQKKKAMSRWYAVYSKHHPLAQGKGSAMKQKSEVSKRIKEAEDKGEKPDVEKIEKQVADEAKPFAKVIQDTLGVSQATAQRYAKVAKHIPQESLDILAAQKASEQIHQKIADLGDRKKVEKAIKLIASGMDHAEAVRNAAKPEHGSPEAKKTEKEEAKPKAATEMTDDEWLLHHCTPLLSLLKGKTQAPFRKDAILYRRLVDVLSKIRTPGRKALAEAKATKNGHFYWAIFRAVNASHPAQWQECGLCEGRGYTLEGEGDAAKKVQCSKCWGSAYILTTED